MFLIESNKNDYKILSENSLDKLIDVMVELTDVYENQNIFFVKEEFLKNNIIIRDFATKEKGYYSSLIICTDICRNVISE